MLIATDGQVWESADPPGLVEVLGMEVAPRMTARKRQSFAGLRPNAQITCFNCEQVRTSVGAVKFRAHQVCAECVAMLRAKEEAQTAPA
jgi:hypothetical protein